MNLYKVSDASYAWCAFTFAVKANYAKLMVAHEFNEEYINLRCKTIKKDVGGEPEVCDGNSERLLECGAQYAEADDD